MQPTSGEQSLLNQRLKMLLIFILFAAPVVAAWVWNANIERWRPTTTTNYGELITPARPLGALNLPQLDGKPLAKDFLRGKWTLVYIGPANCDKACQENLYVMRQVRLALNEKMERVQRLWIISDAQAAPRLPVLLSDHPGLAVVRPQAAARAAVLDAFKVPGPDLVENRIYIVDPMGNLMMRYPARVDAKGVLKDVQRLLLTSWVG
ncbi:MAG: SCO family protein [Gammaproteobacteria bacterium]